MRLELSLALKQLFAKNKEGFISFILIVSVSGIALGIISLITVLSVMNGFQQVVRSKLVGITAELQVTSLNPDFSNWASVREKILALKDPRVISVEPFINGQSLLSYQGQTSFAFIKAFPIFQQAKGDFTSGSNLLDNSISPKGALEHLTPGSFNIILGKGLASEVGVNLGQKITLAVPSDQTTVLGMIPRVKSFKVIGFLDLHLAEYDQALALTNLSDAGKFFNLQADVTGLAVKLTNIDATSQLQQKLTRVLNNEDVIVNDWISQHQTYFAAVSVEKRMMFLVLSLIVAVAAFNLVSSLFMIVKERSAEIAILRTIGISRRGVLLIFLFQGLILGTIGTLAGLILGLPFAYYVGHIVNFLQNLLGRQFINPEVYMIDFLPSKIMLHDVLTVAGFTMLLSFLATIYPSLKASRVDPVEILRSK